ncbi:MAG: hypothetical protein AAGG44_00505 [Planctomycetota bacterium]
MSAMPVMTDAYPFPDGVRDVILRDTLRKAKTCRFFLKDCSVEFRFHAPRERHWGFELPFGEEG